MWAFPIYYHTTLKFKKGCWKQLILKINFQHTISVQCAILIIDFYHRYDTKIDDIKIQIFYNVVLYLWISQVKNVNTQIKVFTQFLCRMKSSVYLVSFHFMHFNFLLNLMKGKKIKFPKTIIDCHNSTRMKLLHSINKIFK